MVKHSSIDQPAAAEARVRRAVALLGKVSLVALATAFLPPTGGATLGFGAAMAQESPTPDTTTTSDDGDVFSDIADFFDPEDDGDSDQVASDDSEDEDKDEDEGEDDDDDEDKDEDHAAGGGGGEGGEGSGGEGGEGSGGGEGGEGGGGSGGGEGEGGDD